jgi:hypothetical protein
VTGETLDIADGGVMLTVDRAARTRDGWYVPSSTPNPDK